MNIINSILGVLLGVLKSLWVNKWDVVAVIVWPMIFSSAASWLIATGNESFAIVINVLYALTICSVAVHAPWIFMGITAPKTWGVFITDKWEGLWRELHNGHQINAQFKVVWITYLVLVAVFGLIAAISFVGIPSLG